MTARDLLNKRTTNEMGDTIWQNSPLVTAALEGKLAVLDGIDQVHASTLSVIYRYNFYFSFSAPIFYISLFFIYESFTNGHLNSFIYFIHFFRLVNDRELQLHDGTRLLRADRYDFLKEAGEDLTKVQRVHPDFL